MDDLTDEEKLTSINVVYEYPYQVHSPGDKSKSTNVLKHNICTTDKKSEFTRQYRFPQIYNKEIKKQVQELLENNIIQPSLSPYNSCSDYAKKILFV